MSIKRLPGEVVNQIKSSTTLVTLNDVACGLIKNSLDASATKIHVQIDYARGNCTVEDNGDGIGDKDFDEEGGLGKPHHTSRYPYKSDVFGKLGNFLANVATLSLMVVTSQARNSTSQSSLTLHHGKILTRDIPTRLEQALVRYDHGTRVCVKDVFGSMPVRVKQRSLMFSRRYDVEKEFRRLIKDVVALLLGSSTNATVSLKDIQYDQELRLRPTALAASTSRTSRLYIQANMVENLDSGSLIPVYASANDIVVRGCISKHPVPTRHCQVISLGIHPIKNDYSTNILHEEIRRLFENSQFGVSDGNDPNYQTQLDRQPVTKLTSRKGIVKWPLFYLQILATPVEKKYSFEGSQTCYMLDSGAVLDLLKAVCYGFLKKHGFKPQKIQSTPKGTKPSLPVTLNRSRKQQRKFTQSQSSTPDRTLTARRDTPFDTWNRVKAGYPTAQRQFEAIDKSKGGGDRITGAPLISECGKLPQTQIDAVCSISNTLDMNDKVEHSNSPRLDEQQLDGQARSCKTVEIHAGTRARLSLGSTSREAPSKWLQRIQKSWENPVFEVGQRLVPRFGATDEAKTHSCQSHRCSLIHNGVGAVDFESRSIGINARISRAALCRAELIAQVDRKFLLMKLPLDGATNALDHSDQPSALVMIDQHAADERWRLESLMAKYFERIPESGLVRAIVEPLDKPLIYDITAKERKLFQQRQLYLAAWGINYHLSTEEYTPVSALIEGNAPRQAYTIRVTKLSPSILERCRTEPRLLIDLLRKEAWKAEGEVVTSSLPSLSSSRLTESPASTSPSFHGCPKGILELLHSRACRSAIMFNDELSRSECEALVQRLSRCAFPFQCAHGRPSMVPLVDLGRGAYTSGWQERNEVVSQSRNLGKWQHWLNNRSVDNT